MLVPSLQTGGRHGSRRLLDCNLLKTERSFLEHGQDLKKRMNDLRAYLWEFFRVSVFWRDTLLALVRCQGCRIASVLFVQDSTAFSGGF